MMKRKLNPKFDSQPSIHHVFNFKIAKPYLKDKNVLDVGCWTGQFEKLAVRHVSKIIGIDPDKEAVNYAKKQVPEADFKIGQACNLQFPDNSFDAVVFLEVIEHLPKNTEIKALSEIKRVLKPGGYLILSTPNNHFLSILLDPAFFLVSHRHYSVSKLNKFLNTEGFKIIKVYKTGGIYRLLSGLLEILIKHLFNKKMVLSAKYKEKLKNEYLKDGFTQIHIIAKNKKH